MHKHLTTPWEAKGGSVFAGKDCIAICDTDNADQQTYEAKARLMAAAPALVAALRSCELAVDGLNTKAFKQKPKTRGVLDRIKATCRAALRQPGDGGGK